MKRIIGFVVLIAGIAIIRVFPVGVIPAFIIFLILNRSSKNAVSEAILPKESREDKRSIAEIAGRGLGRGVKKIKNGVKRINGGVKIKMSSKDKNNISVTNCKVSSSVLAVVTINSVHLDIDIPLKKIMYALSNPRFWDDIDNAEMTKEFMGKCADTIFELLNSDNKLLAEVLLKIAGKHPNSFENEYFEKFLNDREFAIQQSKMYS